MEHLITFFSELYNYVKDAFEDISTNIQPVFSTIFTQIGYYFTVYLVFSYVAYVFSVLFRSQLPKSKYFYSTTKRVLIITAHPDDECMFFGPLIVRLLQSTNNQIYLLCLSKGDAENQGHLRKQELYDSCKKLGIPPENILLCYSSLRMDGPQYMWKSDNIARLVQDYVESYDIDTVVTFDKNGVSGHQNHCALFRAISFANLRNWLPENCRIFLLDSVGIVRKYSSLIDCGLSLLTSEHVFVLSISEHEVLRSAMSMHKTQYVWFRKLYMFFSRYAYVNTLFELNRFKI